MDVEHWEEGKRTCRGTTPSEEVQGEIAQERGVMLVPGRTGKTRSCATNIQMLNSEGYRGTLHL